MATATKPVQTKRLKATRPPADTGGASRTGAALNDVARLLSLGVDLIDPSPFQPRRVFDKAALQELAEDLARNGLLQPVVVRRVPDPHHPGDANLCRYQLIAGERRWRAARLAQWRAIPAIVREVTDEQAAALALVENLKRRDLAPLEEARAYLRLVEEHGWSQEKLADQIGVARSSVGDRLRLLAIGPWVALLEKGEITVSQAVELGKFAKVHEAGHRAAIKAARDYFRAYLADGDRSLATVPVKYWRERIADVVASAALYPLDKREKAYDQVAVPVAQHDKECGCGRFQAPSRWPGEKGRLVDFCSNPSWWEPQIEKAEAARDRAEREAEKKSGKMYLELPKKTPAAKADHHGPTGWDRKQYVGLTDNYGGWLLTREWGLRADPADLVIDAAKLAQHKGYGTVPQVLTTDRAAVETARAKWAARWAVRRAALLEEFRRELHPHVTESAIVGKGAPRLLAEIARFAAGQVLACAEAAGVDVERVTALAVKLGDERMAREWDRGNVVHDWAIALSAQDAATVLTWFTARRSCHSTVPDYRLREEERAELARLEAETPNPWLRNPDGTPVPAPGAQDGRKRGGEFDDDDVDDDESDGEPDDDLFTDGEGDEA